MLSLLVLLSITISGKCVVFSQELKKAGAPQHEQWGYVDVRDKAHMFFWLYYTTSPVRYEKAPLVMWLQGGPGGSSTGFGNFEEIGPLDVKLKPRKTTWLSVASLLFVDNPVGAGFSYVDDDSAFTTNVSMIAEDLLTLLKAFMKRYPDFKGAPFYIFSESYGGKMTAAFSMRLHEAVHRREVSCNFKGLAMGDSWISPVDSVSTWGTYLYATSLVDDKGAAAIANTAQKITDLINKEEWDEATTLWGVCEGVVENVTSGVNFYNILQWGKEESSTRFKKEGRLFQRHVGYMLGDALSDLMNGPIREKLKIIPKNVTWSGQSGAVFKYMTGDFMKSVVNTVDDLTLKTNLSVVVYNGQLDLIVDTLGTEKWVSKLKVFKNYISSPRKQLLDDSTKLPTAYVKSYKNFHFFWILDAGHMVPADNPNGALLLLKMVTQTDK